MCGIAGILATSGPPPTMGALASMAAALAHRGPDGLGVYRDARAGLAHARLAIVDLAGGAQPLSNEDGTLWITYSGEVYDHVELRAELEARGHRFRTASDTEVVVHAWEEWGERALERFDGQFAFAIWDARRGELVLCRDRLGVRPLHYAERGGRVLFASEVKALFAGDPELPRALDPRGLDEAFTFWSTLAPRTPFVGVRELPPGHVRRYARGDATERAWWRPRFAARGDARLVDGDDAAIAERVRGALEDATRLRLLRADVPVGAYISGGLDSAMIAALAARAATAPLRTFSLRFEDPGLDEGPWQRLVVERLGTEHEEVLVRRGDVAEALPAVVHHAERPLLRTAPAPMLLLARRVRAAGLRVVLTGEGADELFGGYDLFREATVRRFWARRPGSAVRPLLLDRLYPWLARSPASARAVARAFFGRDLDRALEPGFGHGPRWAATRAIGRVFSADVRRAIADADPVGALVARLAPEVRGWDPLAVDQLLELETLLAGQLLSSQGDRVAMASAVEGRFPFLSRDVVELATALAPRHKLRVLDEKHALKGAARGLVPAEVRSRKKQPYRAPDAIALVGPHAPAYVADLVDERAVREAGIFDPRAVTLLFEKARAQAAAGSFSHADDMAVVGVVTTSLLHRAFVDEPPTRRAAPRLATIVDRLAGPPTPTT
jgi:asparagine synthase (glutamine-hydrolysing)